MAVIQGVLTDVGRAKLAKSALGSVAGYTWSYCSYFEIGEGGWIQQLTGRVPKTPSVAKTNIEADGSAGNSFFKKYLTSDRMLFVSPSTAQIDCYLSLEEGNDDGYGDSPNYFEIGVFDEDDVLLFYCTMPEETKNNTKILHHTINIVF